MLKTEAVPEIHGTDFAPLHASIQQRRPIKAHGLITHWPAMDWTFEKLTQLFGGKTVKALLDLPKTGGVLPGGQQAYETSMTFSQFVERVFKKGAAPCYMGYSRTADFLGEHTNDYDFASLTLPSKESTDTRIWIGSQNTCSGLHTDLKDNIFAQVVGKKRVYLVPKNETHLAYPFIDNLVNSQIDPENYEEKKFPKFKRATIYFTVVGPGDVLFIPKGWWHYLRSENPSVSVNHWFGPPMSALAYMGLLCRLGPSYVSRTVVDMAKYCFLGKKYQKDFFYSPPSTGERLFNLIRYGNFSKDNDPVTDGKKGEK